MYTTYIAPVEPSTATPVGRSNLPSVRPGPPRVALYRSTKRKFLTAPDETSMSDAPKVAALTASLNSTVNGTASGSVGLDRAGVIAGTGGVLSCVIKNRAAALPFPAASRAAPAGMSTTTVPSDAGETSKEYEEPPPAKLAVLLLDAMPESMMSPGSNPVTASLNSTAKLIVAALVGPDCAAVIAGTGGVLSCTIENLAAASL